MIKSLHQYLATINELLDLGNALQCWPPTSQVKCENDQASTFLQYKEQKTVFIMTQKHNQQNPA